jgi:hypothetical protein
MSGYLCNGGANRVLEDLLRSGPRWLSLHDTEPTVLGTGEIAGGGYLRQRCRWVAPANQQSALDGGIDDEDNDSTTVIFDDLPDFVLRWFGVWSTAAGTSEPMLVAIERTESDGTTPAPLTVSEDQRLTIPRLSLVVGPFGPGPYV